MTSDNKCPFCESLNVDPTEKQERLAWICSDCDSIWPVYGLPFIEVPDEKTTLDNKEFSKLIKKLEKNVRKPGEPYKPRMDYDPKTGVLEVVLSPESYY